MTSNPIGRTRRVGRLGRRVAVEQGRRLVRQVAHEAARERRQVGRPRARRAIARWRSTPRAARRRTAPVARGADGPRPRSARRPHPRRPRPPGPRPRTSTCPSARSVRPIRGSGRDRRRRGRGRAPPAWRRRRGARSRREPWARCSRARRTRSGSVSSATADPRALLLLGAARTGPGTERPRRRETGNPGPSARGCGGSRCERWTYERVDTGLREPSRHVQVIPCVRIRRRLCLLGSHIVNGVDAGAAILWNPCACHRCSRPRCARIRPRPRSRATACLLRGGFIRQVMAGVYTIAPARPAHDAQDRGHRPRGDGRRGRAGDPDADPAARRPVEGDRPVRPVRRHPVQAHRPPRPGDGPRPDAGRGRRAARGRRPALVPRPAGERLPGRVEVPRRVPPAVRAAAGAGVPDEGRVLVRPRRGRDARVVPGHVRGVRADLRPLRAATT